MVDAICMAVYGDEPGYTEAVLEANPGLADIGPILPAGVVVSLPDLAAAGDAAEPEVLRLWD